MNLEKISDLVVVNTGGTTPSVILTISVLNNIKRMRNQLGLFNNQSETHDLPKFNLHRQMESTVKNLTYNPENRNPQKLNLLSILTIGLPILTLPSLAKANDNLPLTINRLVDLKQDCTVNNNSVDSLGKAFVCGAVSGAAKANYYSLHNAYFFGQSQDTSVVGGYIRYETAPFYGVQGAVGYDMQRRIDDDNGHAEVSEFKNDKDGLAEAYLKWENDKARFTIGNQRLDLPFLGDYADWRVLQNLYQAADIQIGKNDDFIRATKVNKFKSYADDELYKTSRQDEQLKTDGMWSIGLGKGYKLSNGNQLKGQTWYESYDEYTKLAYLQGNFVLPNHPLKPDFALQYMIGKDQGKALAGKVDSSVIGAQISLKPTSNITTTFAYDYIKPKADAYLNGSLLTPYAHNTSSGAFFAQPFFTSTQDLGAGNAYMIGIDAKYNELTNLGTRLSYMDLKETPHIDSRKQTELMAYAIYNFTGKLHGVSISDFAGIQHSTRSRGRENFLQNRLALTVKF